MARGAALEALGVDAGYRDRRVLEDVSLEVDRGVMVAVIGPNGAGKSTLLRVLSGTLQPARGEVRLFGAPLSTIGRRDVARRLAVVPQESGVAFGFSVREVVMMGRAPHQRGLLFASPGDEEAVNAAIRACGLEGVEDRPVAELSGGERRRVVIARAIAQQTDVLLLDEAATHLDVRHALAVHELARREVSERGVACVSVVHDLNAAARWADRVVLLHEGRVHAAGTVDDVLRPDVLVPVFGVDIVEVRDGRRRVFVPA